MPIATFKGTELACTVSCGFFDLDHVRAIIGEQLCRIGANNFFGQIKNTDILQWSRHGIDALNNSIVRILRLIAGLVQPSNKIEPRGRWDNLATELVDKKTHGLYLSACRIISVQVCSR